MAPTQSQEDTMTTTPDTAAVRAALAAMRKRVDGATDKGPFRVMVNAPGGAGGWPALVGPDGFALANGDPSVLQRAAAAMNDRPLLLACTEAALAHREATRSFDAAVEDGAVMAFIALGRRERANETAAALDAALAALAEGGGE